MDDTQRQARIAFFVMATILPVGIVGFMLIEGWNVFEAAYFTIITLSTVGYGEITPSTQEGQLFAIFLILTGLGAFAFAAQATVALITSPALRRTRHRRRIQRQIDRLNNHYIICGMGEMVDKTVGYLLQGAQSRRETIRQQQYQPVDNLLDSIFGDDDDGHFLWFRRPLKRLILAFIRLFRTQATLLDVVVVITQDEEYAEDLRNNGLLVLKGDPASDDVLLNAGLQRARALMVLLDNDTETLLTVLTAHTLSPTLHISAAVLDDELSQKMTRVGANSVITPYDTAGQFLNSATLRPAVNDYFNSLLFEHQTHYRLTQLKLYDDSPWIGQTIGTLKLRDTYDTGVIGIRYASAHFGYDPPDTYRLKEDETLIVVAPTHHIKTLKAACRGSNHQPRLALWQPLPKQHPIIQSDTHYTLVESEAVIQEMQQHFIICGTDHIARSATEHLNPSRPFVIISNDNTYTSELLRRGFRVVHGNPTSEDILRKAGVERAQALMVSLDNKASSVLTILSSRTLNKSLLITTTASDDDMIEKLQRAGADRVLSPFHVAARFILLTTTRPELAEFVNYVLFNYDTELETTEIYTGDNSVWIGQKIADLHLRETYKAGVIGIRQAHDGHFIYAPPEEYIIQPQDVLIIVCPMAQSDSLLSSAHDGTSHHPATLRSRALQTSHWTPDDIQKMLKRARENRR